MVFPFSGLSIFTGEKNRLIPRLLPYLKGGIAHWSHSFLGESYKS